MQGVVVGLSKNKRRVAVLTDYGYTVFDLHDGDVSINDFIEGDLDNHGDQVLTNQTSECTLCVYTEAIQASKESAESLLFCK
jgi:hypothetical protein